MEIPLDIIKKTDALKNICVDSQNRLIGVLKSLMILGHNFFSFFVIYKLPKGFKYFLNRV